MSRYAKYVLCAMCAFGLSAICALTWNGIYPDIAVAVFSLSAFVFLVSALRTVKSHKPR